LKGCKVAFRIRRQLQGAMTLNQFLIFLVIGIAIAVATSGTWISTWIWWILAACTVLVVIKLLSK